MYSGKESSPLGLGIAAEPLVLGTIQEGKDKTNWIVALKNGVKVWSRITRMSELRDREEETVKKIDEKNTKTAHAHVHVSVSVNEDDKTEAVSPKKARKPTDYNIYMKYTLMRLAKEQTELEPKKRIAHAVGIWQSMKTKPDEKAKMVQEAKDALGHTNE